MCVAAVRNSGESRDLFHKLLLWGGSMTIVGAIICQLLAGWIAKF
jgi:hypothetical protein